MSDKWDLPKGQTHSEEHLPEAYHEVMYHTYDALERLSRIGCKQGRALAAEALRVLKQMKERHAKTLGL